MQTLSAHFFHWNGNHGSAEFSDLLRDKLQEPILEGFQVAGRTCTKTFKLTAPKRDSEGEVEHWSYISECKQFRITIWND